MIKTIVVVTALLFVFGCSDNNYPPWENEKTISSMRSDLRKQGYQVDHLTDEEVFDLSMESVFSDMKDAQ